MKNLYRRLGFDHASVSSDAIRAKLAQVDHVTPVTSKQCSFGGAIREKLAQVDLDPETREEIKMILLDNNKRRVYDQHWKIMQQLGELRARLNLSRISTWLAVDGAEFDSSESPAKASPAVPKQTPRTVRNFGEIELGWRSYTALGLIIAAIILWFSPGPHYFFASTIDTKDSYKSFISKFPRSDFTARASERLKVLSEDDVWKGANESTGERTQLERLRSYASTYPSGKYIEEAKAGIVSLVDKHWFPVESSVSISELENFRANYPESTYVLDAGVRIETLRGTWSWVTSENTIESYKGYLLRHPNGRHSADARKRLIDLEVAQIARGDHGVLPKSNPVRAYGGLYADVRITNETGYQLTVRYSGPSSDMAIIERGASASIRLTSGNYKVAASVNASNVRNYYGTEDLRGGEYEIRFFIQKSIGW